MKKQDKDFIVDDAEESSGFLLWQVTTLWQRGIKKVLDRIDITHPQFVLLASLLWLSKQKDYITQIDLSLHSKIDPMTTSMVIRTLERKELIKREAHLTDTRAKSILLTEKGIVITRRAVKVIEKFDTAFFQELGSETKEFNRSLLLIMNSSKV